MSLYEDAICNECPRFDYCEFPCEEYSHLKLKKDLAEKKIEIVNAYEDNDISDFLEFGVESIEWLRVCNSQIPYTELLDKNAFHEYFRSENEKYCEEQGICNVCRNPLIEFAEKEDGMTSEKYWACSYGC